MPTYEYKCKCGHSYEEFRSITSPQPEACPECGTRYGDGFEQAFDNYDIIGWTYGNPTTVGQQAEINAKRVGKERLAEMAREDRERTKFTGKLPQGAETLKTKASTPWWRAGESGLPKMDKPLDLSKVPDVKKYIETGNK